MHRVSVAVEDKSEAIIKSGDFGKGFMHVMNEESFRDVLTKLDTIENFVGYLVAKEAFARSGTLIVCEGSESNMLGWCMTHKRRRKVEDEARYAWDSLIHVLAYPNTKSIQGSGPDLNDLELALRLMARESRYNRRALGSFVLAFLNDAKKGAIGGRLSRGRAA